MKSTPTIRLRDILAFTAVMIDPEIMKPFSQPQGHSERNVEKMSRAWGKSRLSQIALWTEPYTNP
ncbi:MAG: hypothetical protein ACRD8A_05760 [Candidatus Acidiferrales bacterium]